MNITSKVTIGLVSIVFVAISFAFVSSASAQAQSVAELQQEIQRLQALYDSLNRGSTSNTRTVTTTTVGGNAVCPYTWTRNLTTGSSGEDVRQLQRFLNGNPQTQVAVTGYGSPGNETTTFGPATHRAVAKFQELYAAQVLTPLGLMAGTGGFFNSTRSHANSMCASSGNVGNIPGAPSVLPPNTPTSRNTERVNNIRVTGNAIAVTAGRHPGDSYAMVGAQRVPYTAIALTAGSNDVRIEGVYVEQFGLSSADNFESIALVDANGVQIGTARKLNRDGEVRLGGNLLIPANRSVTLFVVGNVADDAGGGAISGLEVVNVAADAQVQGNFPIRGAAHVFSDAITLQEVKIEANASDTDIELGEETEIASFEFSLNDDDADEEDAYLKSVAFEQIGNADEDEIGDITVLIDGDPADYDLMIDGDRYTVTFSGRGELIEEDDSIDLTIEVETYTGSGQKVRFEIEDESDVYVVGAKYGYGLALEAFTELKSGTGTILTGKISRGGRVKDFEDEVTYGDDRVLGAFLVEFEGEDVIIEGLHFSAELSSYGYKSDTDNPWDKAEEDEVSLDNLHLRVDGERIAFADDDVEFTKAAAKADSEKIPDADGANGPTKKIKVTDVVFEDEFEVNVRGEQEVLFEIVGDLNSDWSHFDGTNIEFVVTSVEKAEGVSSEKSFVGNVVFMKAKYDEVEIVGNVVEFEIDDNNVDDASRVAGSDDVPFGTLVVDATDTIDDIELKDLFITFEASSITGTPDGVAENSPASQLSDLGNLNDCRVLHDGDEVADARGSLDGEAAAGTTKTDTLRFKFDDVVVDAGEEVDLDIVCDIDDDAATVYSDSAGNSSGYRIKTAEGDKVEYLVRKDEFDYAFEADQVSELIVISGSGELKISVDNPDEDEDLFAVEVGTSGVDNVAVLEVDVEAEEEDVRILDVYLSGVSLGGALPADTTLKDAIDEVVSSVWFEIDGSRQSVRPRDFETETVSVGPDAGEEDVVNYFHFEDVNKTIGSGDEETFVVKINFGGIDENDGQAGQYLEAANLVIVWEGEESDAEGVTAKATTGVFTKALTFPTVPTVSAVSQPSSTDSVSNGNDRELYRFTVTAGDEGDVYLGETAFDVSISSGVTLANFEVRHGSTKIGNAASSVAASGTTTVSFDANRIQEIEEGETKTYSVYADITGIDDNKSITVELAADAEPATPAAQVGQTAAVAKSAFNFVWSPNALEGDGDLADENKDWFGGWGIFESSEIDSWTRERD